MVALAAGCGLLGANQVNAQTADALIDKLVDKGILTTAEAQALRTEADQGFKEAYRKEAGLPGFVENLRFSGDFRGRYDGLYPEVAGFSDRHRLRYRLRYGVTAELADQFETGFRLGSGDVAGISSGGGDPISSNQTFGSNAAKKGIFIDLAYAAWQPLKDSDWSAATTFGKMQNPFKTPDLMFDADYTPEGIAQTFGYKFSKQHTINAAGAAYVLNELNASSNDPWLFGGQTRWDAKWSPAWGSSLSLGYFAINNEENLRNTSVPNINVGNERDPVTTVPLYGFHTWLLDGGLTYTLPDGIPGHRAAFPIALTGSYQVNTEADRADTGWTLGLQLGKSGKRGLWDVSYRYKYLEANAWYEELTDSDTGTFYPAALSGSGQGAGYRAGTNLKGHFVTVRYSPFDAVTLGLNFGLTEALNPTTTAADSQVTRILADASFRF